LWLTPLDATGAPVRGDDARGESILVMSDWELELDLTVDRAGPDPASEDAGDVT
jgi:hypothetical protein